jgi:hypothetical protein
MARTALDSTWLDLSPSHVCAARTGLDSTWLDLRWPLPPSQVFAPLFLAINDGGGLISFIVPPPTASVSGRLLSTLAPALAPAVNGEIVAAGFGALLGMSGLFAVQRITAVPR